MNGSSNARALHVVDEDVQVVRIDQRALRRRVEEVRRVADDELIERRAAGDHHGRRAARPASGAAGALPRGCNRARIAGHDRHVERADVDAEFQRVRGHDRAHRAFAQALFDFTAAERQVAAAVAADPLGLARAAFEVVLEVGRQDLGREAALRKDNQLQVALQEFRRDPARFARDRSA